MLERATFSRPTPPAVLPSARLLHASRQAETPGALAEQALATLEILLHGALAGPDAASDDPDQLHDALRTVLLRLVFQQFAGDRGLLHVDDPGRALFDSLAAGSPPRHAWPRLLAAWEARHAAGGGEFFAPARVARLTHGLDDPTLHRALARLLLRDGQRVSTRGLDVEQLGGVYAALLDHRVVRVAGRLELRPGPERRRTGAHYTPRALTELVVRTTLAPVLAALGPAPSSARLLDLRICDPAMGAGAFLLAVVRSLADELAAAWIREGDTDSSEPLVQRARRLVASRCIVGVDKDPCAVDLARLSLWLFTDARDLPLTCLDHALRCGDSLLGLTRDQLVRFHWDLTAPVDPALQAALTGDHADRARLLADLVVGAFFSRDRPRDREHERRRRHAAALAWLRSDGPAPAALRQLQAALHASQRPFHWPLELPRHGIDAVVGNPPFAGKNGITAVGGPHYVDWLQAVHPGAHGNADLSAHFLRRADTLLNNHGTIGLIATNTIGRGDTRATGLQHLVARRGYTIHAATRDLPWPEAAAVTISIVHLARGDPANHLPAAQLHDPDPDAPGALVRRVVPAINSRLRPGREHPDPVRLTSNLGLSFQGSIVHGTGFILTADERAALTRKDPRNAARISLFLGGDEINGTPALTSERHIIDFGQLALADVEAWPDLLRIVRERVRPARERQRDPGGRRFWWRFLRPRPELHATLAALPRCLVTSAISKHRVFAFQPTDRVFSHNLNVLTAASHTFFAVVSSSLHTTWATLHSSGLETRSGYRPTDCFENFPFPDRDPLRIFPALEALGERLDAARTRAMQRSQHGLTRTYNALRDPACVDPTILELRALHVELDRAVLAAYGWSDLPVPAFTTPRSPAERRDLATFEDAILDRLFALNTARAADEARALTRPPRARTGSPSSAPTRPAR